MKTIAVVSSILFSLIVQAAIPKLEQKDFSTLIKTANDSSRSMTERWQSLVRAGEIAKSDQIIKIQEFSKSSDWFMRNASLISLEAIIANYAVEQAKILIQDKALVVRSAAVTSLKKKNSLEIRRLLAAELAKTYNFSGLQSLWIRPQIMEHLANTATASDRQFMARYLFDKDTKVVLQSILALEKITSVEFSGPQKIQDWQKFVKENNWL